MTQKSRTSISLEGWYYLIVMAFVVAGALMREINLLMVLFGMMLGAFLFSWRLARRASRGLRFRRRVPSVVGAGEPLTVDVEVRNPRRRGSGWALAVEDTLRLELPLLDQAPSAARLFFQQVPAGQTRRQSYQGRLAQRGRYRFGPMRCVSSFPIGLLRETLTFDEPSHVIVYPRLGRLTAAWSRQRRDAVSGAQLVQRPVGLREGDYHGLREWRAGDSRRWIHWRTTARRGELMVRQFEQHRNHDLVLLVELWQSPQPTDDERETIERVVRFAATLLSDRCGSGGGSLVLALAGRRPLVLRGPASQALYRDAMEQLAVADGVSVDALPDLLGQALDNLRGGADVVLVSTRSVDLSDTARFRKTWEDKHQQAWLGRVLTIDARGGGLDAWYEEDDTDAH
jgi:uncharacterized protein (DUF58 family)